MMIIGLVVVVYGRIKHVRSLAMPTRFLRMHAVCPYKGKNMKKREPLNQDASQPENVVFLRERN